MIKPKTTFKLYTDNDPKAFFGPGPYRLLCYIKETRSIVQAAKRMNMAYTKALSLIKRAETAIGQPLVLAKTGGKGGGGSELTESAELLLLAYAKTQNALEETAQTLFIQHFSNLIK